MQFSLNKIGKQSRAEIQKIKPKCLKEAHLNPSRQANWQAKDTPMLLLNYVKAG